jgi:hypothetical protein
MIREMGTVVVLRADRVELVLERPGAAYEEKFSGIWEGVVEVREGSR